MTLDKLRCWMGSHQWEVYRDQFKSETQQVAEFEWRVCEVCSHAELLRATLPRRISGKAKEATEAQAQA